MVQALTLVLDLAEDPLVGGGEGRRGEKYGSIC